MSRRGENIYKRKDGRYEGRYVIGKTPLGRTKFGYVYGRQYHTVRNKLIEKKAELLRQAPKREGSTLRLHEWMERWLEFDCKKRVRVSSYQTYLRSYQKHILPALGNFSLNSLTSEDIQCFVEQLDENGLAPATVQGIYRLLSSGLCTAFEEGLIPKNPCRRLRVAKRVHNEQRVLSPAELARIHKIAEKEANLAALLGLHTGIRLGEICALRWTDIDWDRQTLSIRRSVQRISEHAQCEQRRTRLLVGAPKSRGSQRCLPLSAKLLAQLQQGFEHKTSDYILGSNAHPIDPRTIQRQFKRLALRAGIQDVHFHTLRHSFATRLLHLGIDIKTVSMLLGHSSARTTLEFYAHSQLEEQRNAVEKFSVHLTQSNF